MSDTHSFGGSGDGDDSPHLTHNLSAGSAEGGNSKTLSFECNDAAAAEQMIKEAEFFKEWKGAGTDFFPAGGSTTSGAGWSVPYLARATMRRVRGPVVQVDFLINQVRVKGIWGLDFAETSKPIMAWYKPGTRPSDTSEDSRPSGQKIRAWQKLGNDNPASPDYNSFKVDGVKLTGATRILAEMMYRGIETFPVWVPVVTWQCKLFDPPDVTLYPPGMQLSELAAPHGITELGDKDFLGYLNALTSKWTLEPYIWVRSGSKVATNPDGTYIWNMTFQAAEQADSDLYPVES